MTQLWPRISQPVANKIFESIANGSIDDLKERASLHHARETFAATGGHRVSQLMVGQLAEAVRTTAAEFGYPGMANDAHRIAFDRAVAEIIYQQMSLTSVEAATRGVWTFLALVVLPDVTQWRFGRNNPERWVASDLTRHMFSRLWWQALTFGIEDGRGVTDFSLLRKLSERDLNQITERRSIGGNTRLAQGLARIVTVDRQQGKKDLLREIARTLNRRLAFIDFSVLDSEQIDDHLRSLAR